jgi:hypothetical protein
MFRASRECSLETPTTLIVGDVVYLADTIGWFSGLGSAGDATLLEIEDRG